MFASTTAIPIVDNDTITSRIVRCLDGRVKDIGGIPYIKSLLRCIETAKGKSELDYFLYGQENDITAFVVAILYCSNHDEIRKNKRRDFLLPDNITCPISLDKEYLLLMESFLFSSNGNSQKQLSSYYKENKNKNKGWIKSWFCENENYIKKKKKASLSDTNNYKYFILSLHICMLKGEDNYHEQDLAHAWDISVRLVRGKREKIAKLFKQNSSNLKQRRAPPTIDLSSPAVYRADIQSRRKSFVVSPLKSPRHFLWNMISSPKKESQTQNQTQTQTNQSYGSSVSTRLIATPMKVNNSKADNDHDGYGGGGYDFDHDHENGHIEYDSNNNNQSGIDFSIIESDDDDNNSNTNHSDPMKAIPVHFPNNYPEVNTNYAIPLAAPFQITPTESNSCHHPLYVNTNGTFPYTSNVITPKEALFKSKPKVKKRPPMSYEQYPLLSCICNLKSKEDDDALLEEVFRYFGKDCIMNKIFDTTSLSSDSKKNEATSINICRPNGTVVTMHQVTKSSNFDRYKINATRTKWLIQILKSTGASSVEEAVGWTIAYLGKTFPEALRWAGKELRLPFLRTRMGVYSSATMWKEANVTWTAQRVIRRYLFCHYGAWLTAPEKHIRQLTDHFVRPTLGQTTIDDVGITYWTKSLLKVIKNLLENEWKETKFDELHAVLGGDHGCGVFSAPSKFIAFDSNGYAIEVAIEKIGHIDCKKDTYDVLEQTIGPIMNEFMKEIKGKFICIPNNGTSISFENDTMKEGCKYHKLELFAIGDLQYTHTALGKVSMDRMWCHICDLSNSQWAELVHTPGRPWTLELMKKMRECTEREKLTGAERRGVVQMPIFDVLEPFRWLIPMLHVMMGQFNHAFEKGVMRYIDNRHESITPDEMDARDLYWNCLNQIEDKQKLFDKRTTQRNDDIDDTTDLINDIEEEKKKQHPVGSDQWKKRKSKYANAEKKEMSKQIAEHKEKIQGLYDIEKEEKSILLSFKEEAKERLSELKILENRKGKKASGKIRNKIDQCLKMHGIDRAAFHGGDFTGVDCLQIENGIEELFKDIKQILIDNPESVVPEEEVDEMFESFELHFLMTSHMVSLTRTPKYVMKDPVKKSEVLDQLREVIPLIDKSIKRLHLSMKTPKRHYVSDHIVEMMDVYDGIAEYYEDWVEQAHQTYRKCTTRGKIRDKAGAANYYARQEKLYQNNTIAKISEVVKEQRNRKFTTDRGPVKAEREQDLRRERRKNAVEQFKVLYAAKPELSTNLQLNLIDCRRQEQDGIDDGVV